MKIIFLIPTLFISVCTYTQQYTTTSKIQTQWKALEVAEPVGHSFGGNNSAFSFKGSALYFGDNEALISGFNLKKGHGLFRIDKEGVNKWETFVPGLIIGFGKFKSQIIAFYTKDWQDRNTTWVTISQVHAVLIDMQTGDKLADQVVFKNPGTAYTDVKALNRPDGEFQQLLVRVSSLDKIPYMSSRNNTANKRANTNSLNILTFNEDLIPTSKAINPETLGGIFVGSMVNAEGTTFIAVMDKGKLILKKFDRELQQTDKLEAVFNVDLLDISSINMVLSSINSNAVIMSTKYSGKDDIIACYSFDFANNKALSANQVMDKNWAKQLKEESKNEVNLQTDGLKKIINLVVVGTAQTTDKIIFIYQEKYPVGPIDGHFTRNDGILIMIYDRQLKLLKNVIVDKENENHNSVDMYLSVGYHIKDNKLFVIANSGVDVEKKKVLLTTVDLTTLHKEQFDIINEYGRLECGPTLWFDDRFLLNEVGPECHYYFVNYK